MGEGWKYSHLTGRQTWRGQYLGEGIYKAGEEIRREYGKPHRGPYGTTYVLLIYVCGKGESSCTHHPKVVRTSPGAVMHTHTYTVGSVVLARNQGHPELQPDCLVLAGLICGGQRPGGSPRQRSQTVPCLIN